MGHTVFVEYANQASVGLWNDKLSALAKSNKFNILVKNEKSGHVPDFFLRFSDKIELVTNGTDQNLSLSIDLQKKYKNLKFSKKDILYKAIVGKKEVTTVIDLTAGLLSDAVYFMKAGLKVHAFERNPIIFLFSKLNLINAGVFFFENVNLQFGSFEKKSLAFEEAKTTLYFDPIFQSSKRKSLPSKEMQIVRKIVKEADRDAKEYIANLMAVCHSRIVVKRSSKTDSLSKPIQSYEGSTVVYDVVS